MFIREPTQNSNQPKKDGSTFDPTIDRNESNRNDEMPDEINLPTGIKKPKTAAEIQGDAQVNSAREDGNQKSQNPQNAERR